MKVEYDSNNSGGSFWLKDEDWSALENAGWTVEWRDERWLGTKATHASRDGLSLREAISEWEMVTGQEANALGCYSCCGPPHSFCFEDGEIIEYYSPQAPMYGDEY